MNSSTIDLDPREGPRDECGVFGIYAPESDVARLTYFALYALQHRGQESAGIATTDSDGLIMTRRELGLVAQVFDENDLRTLHGELAIGHVRYSTTGSNAWENSQPVQRSDGSDANRREIALAHNGNLVNAVELHAELTARGVSFRSTSDSEIIAALIATHEADDVAEAIVDVLPRMRGAFSTVVLTRGRVLAFRDPHGLRPLSIGRLPRTAPGTRHATASRARPAPSTSSVRPSSATSSRASSSRSPRTGSSRGRSSRERARPSACSSTSTSPAPTRASAATSRRSCAATWARSWPASPPPTPTS
jgi:amidophosphoribosyltransferase